MLGEVVLTVVGGANKTALLQVLELGGGDLLAGDKPAQGSYEEVVVQSGVSLFELEVLPEPLVELVFRPHHGVCLHWCG